MKIVFVALALAVCVPAWAQGDGPLPQDANRTGEKVEWILDELGYSEDGLTVRDSIKATDLILSALYEHAASAEDFEQTVAELKADAALRDERLLALANEPPPPSIDRDLALWIAAGLLALMIALGVQVFKLSVKVSALQST